MKKTILLAAIAFGALSANATEGKRAMKIEALLAAGAAPAKMSVAKQANAIPSICNEKGTACFPDAAYFCCSNLCVDLACD